MYFVLLISDPVCRMVSTSNLPWSTLSNTSSLESNEAPYPPSGLAFAVACLHSSRKGAADVARSLRFYFAPMCPPATSLAVDHTMLIPRLCQASARSSQFRVACPGGPFKSAHYVPCLKHTLQRQLAQAAHEADSASPRFHDPGKTLEDRSFGFKG
jgi:hypothetical protein